MCRGSRVHPFCGCSLLVCWVSTHLFFTSHQSRRLATNRRLMSFLTSVHGTFLDNGNSKRSFPRLSPPFQFRVCQEGRGVRMISSSIEPTLCTTNSQGKTSWKSTNVSPQTINTCNCRATPLCSTNFATSDMSLDPRRTAAEREEERRNASGSSTASAPDRNSYVMTSKCSES